ncbi:transposable element Tcb2 transposase [Trichonephila clavipes]|nr:transposable element Tcb2 transposase [Trichonephila clavipes]
MMEAGLSARPVARQLGRSDCVRVRRNWTAREWNQVVYSEKSRSNLSNDDNRVRVWIPRGERLNPTFALQRHTTPTPGVMVWNAIAYNSRSSLVLIRDTMTVQWYVQDILQRLPGAIFQQDNSQPHMARVSQDCLRIVTIISWPARSPDLSLIEHVWDNLGRRVGHLTS